MTLARLVNHAGTLPVGIITRDRGKILRPIGLRTPLHNVTARDSDREVRVIPSQEIIPAELVACPAVNGVVVARISW